MRFSFYILCFALISTVTSMSWLSAKNTSSKTTTSVHQVKQLTLNELNQSRLPTPAEKLTLPRPVFPSKPLLYLNRCIGGKTIYNKSVNNSRQDSSTMAQQDEIYFPEYPWGDESWNQVVSHVKDILASFNIEVTETDPGTEISHYESLVCGSYALLSSVDDASVLGVAQRLPFYLLRDSISFVFPEFTEDTLLLAKAVSHEFGHNLTLEHLHHCGAIMGYIHRNPITGQFCSYPAFQDEALPCGTDESRTCGTGAETQNSYQTIDSIFNNQQKTSIDLTVVGDNQNNTLIANGTHLALGTHLEIKIQDPNGLVHFNIRLNDQQIFARDFTGYAPLISNTYQLRISPTTLLGNTTLSTLAIDALGKEINDHVNVIIVDTPPEANSNTRPRITVLSPTANDVVSNGFEVNIAVETSNEIDSIYFNVDLAPVATFIEKSGVTSAIYSFWVPHTELSESTVTKLLSIAAADRFGKVSYEPLEVHVTRTSGPIIAFSNLQQGDIVTPYQPVNFSAQSGDSDGLESISLYINYKRIAHINNSTLTNFQIPQLATDGPIDIELRARSNNGAVASETITVNYVQQQPVIALPQATIPIVMITQPPQNTRVEPGFTIEANIIDPDGIASARFFIDNVQVETFFNESPYQFTTPMNLSQGEHRIDIIATDPLGMTRTESRIVYLGIDPPLPQDTPNSPSDPNDTTNDPNESSPDSPEPDSPDPNDISNPNNDLRRLGEPCTTDDQCASQQCVQGTNLCTQSCTTTATCPLRFVCTESTENTICLPESHIETTVSNCLTSSPQNLFYIGIVLLGLAVLRRRQTV